MQRQAVADSHTVALAAPCSATLKVRKRTVTASGVIAPSSLCDVEVALPPPLNAPCPPLRRSARLREEAMQRRRHCSVTAARPMCKLPQRLLLDRAV